MQAFNMALCLVTFLVATSIICAHPIICTVLFLGGVGALAVQQQKAEAKRSKDEAAKKA